MSFTSLTDFDTLEHILCWEEKKMLGQKRAQILGFFSFNFGLFVCVYFEFLYAVNMCYVGVRRSDCRVS